MFDKPYDRMIKRVPYKILVFIPFIISGLMILVIIFNGLTFGIEFQGGLLVEVKTDKAIDQAALENDLAQLKLENLKVLAGSDVLILKTTSDISTVDKNRIVQVLEKYVGPLSEYDIATLKIDKEPTKDTLLVLQKYGSVSEFKDGKITITASNLDKEELKKDVSKKLPEAELGISDANLLYNSVMPILGADFKTRGITAMAVAFALMAIVVFIAFREFVPSIAVIQAAINDVIIAAGGVSLLGIELEPVSIAALLMLIGYSVDTDILLTSRVLKQRGAEINDQINDAMKTAFTMLASTMSALVVLFVISYTIQLSMWTNIASILLIGLVADIMTTWFTNAGMLKWYFESK